MDKKSFIAKVRTKLAKGLLFYREFDAYFKNSLQLPITGDPHTSVMWMPGISAMELVSPTFKGDKAEYTILVSHTEASLSVDGTHRYFVAKDIKDIFKKIEDIETGNEKI